MIARLAIGLAFAAVGCGGDASHTRDVGADVSDASAPDLSSGEVSVDVPTADISAPPALVLTVESPSQFTPGMASPLSVRSETAYTGVVRLNVGANPVDVMLHRGRGSASVRLDDVAAIVPVTEGVTLSPESPTEIDVRAAWRGDLIVTGELTVAAGETLTIEAGRRVFFSPLARMIVRGDLVVEGTAEAPVLFAAELSDPWGSIEIRGGTATLNHAWLTGGGGRTERFGGHSASDPVIAVVDGTLTMQGGGIVDNVGKALWSERSHVNLDGVLISRCDTGGEHVSSLVTMRKCHILETPDADGKYDDDDNDGIYLRLSMEEGGAPLESLIEDCVFAVGEDDAIDHNEATVRIERVHIDGFRHEGVAASSGGAVTIHDSVVRGCAQGIEVGYGAPVVVVRQTLVTDNGVGLRWGDSYDWEALGSLDAEAVIVAGNRQDIRTDDEQQGEVPVGQFGVHCSVVGDAAWANRDNNISVNWPAEAMCPLGDGVPASCALSVGPEVCR